ncbi:MAG: polysaccharide deacetylase family protein [Chloroflexia bacterium]
MMLRSLRRLLFWLALAGLLVLAGLAAWRLYRRPAASLPLYAHSNLLVNPGFQEDADGDGRPDGWELGPAAEWSTWTITPEPGGHSLRLTGSASYARSVPVAVRPGKRYRLTWQALTDGEHPNRMQAVFLWENSRREVIVRQAGEWQEVPARGWRRLSAEGQAPTEAVGLTVLLRPAGDDPLYLDELHLAEEGVRLEPYPDYARAALAFTFDWETAMGGLIHSRSDDGYDPATAEMRGLAMRQGAENLLLLLERYDLRATWYASGYSLLSGNIERRSFSGNPTYTWASQAHGWRDDRWTATPWFADDPYGTAESRPAWYFGDLLPRLLALGQEVESHTFGHLYIPYAAPDEVRTDLEQWNAVAREAGLPPARTLAFPWGASLGTGDAVYTVLEEAGYIAVTRTYHEPRGRSQYWILPPDDLFHIRTVPGHPGLWAFPDHYFPGRAEDLPRALAVVDRVLLERGVTSLWAHTEEVATPEQVASWEALLSYAAGKRSSGLWIAPLTEIVRYRNDLGQIEVRSDANGPRLQVWVANRNDHTVAGLTLTLPKPVRAVYLEGAAHTDFRLDQVRLPPLDAGREVHLEVTFGEWEEP